MDFTREYNEIIHYSIIDIFDIEYDNNKLNVIGSQIEMIFENLKRLKHDKFYDDSDLKGIIYWLSGHTYTIKKACDNDAVVIDYVCDIIDFIIIDLLVLLEEFELWEFCRNILNIKDILIKDLKNESNDIKKI